MGHINTTLQFASAAEGGFYVWDIVENRFWADARYAEIMGVDASLVNSGLPAEGFLDTVHPDDVALVVQKMKVAVIDDMPFELAYRVKKNDTWVVIQDRAKCLRFVDGYATLFTGMVFAISPRIQPFGVSPIRAG